MKRQNGVVLSGKLQDLQAAEAQVGAVTASAVVATLVTDHPAYGGHHQVVFPEELAREALAFAALTGGALEATVEGWLRSAPGKCVVVVDRVIYHVSQAQRDQVARARATGKPRGDKPAAWPPAAR